MFIILLFVLGFVPIVFANSQACSKEEAQGAELVSTKAYSWQQLHRQYNLYAHCDDGAIAEGFSETVTLLLSNRWQGDIHKLEAILKRDHYFRDFVIRHIDETVPAERLRRISANAAKRCPKNMESLCRDIAAAATSAQKAAQ